MKFGLWIIFLILLTGTLTQDFDLSDALDDLVPPIPAKPKEQPKPPKQPDDFDLSDIFDDLVPPTPAKPKEQPKPPKQPDGGFGLDLEDFFGPVPTEKPPDSPTGGACPKDLDQKLNRIIENQEKLLKLLEQQRPRSSSRFWPTR
ncbi:glycoprotein Xg-like [Sparus aurata]|uniref:glycoprotein Xg-like n=1 Tax=Sparus aurata TaxID=8175 RepID=UPI0011C0EF2B|nr:glycoprotein Xg-like [Sparus aurata]